VPAGGALLAVIPATVMAWNWQDLWLRRDQQAAHALQNGDFARAAELAEDPLQKGVAAYRQGDYQQALQAFSQAQGALAHYNRGNALARLGRLEEARAAYQAALDQQPGLEDARFNRDLIAELLRRQQQTSPSGAGREHPGQQSSPENARQPQAAAEQIDTSSSTADDAETPDQPGDAEPAMANEARQGSDPGSAASQQARSGVDQPSAQPRQDAQAARRQSGEATPGERRPGDEQPRNPPGAAQNAPPTEEQQALEQWLERIPDDPGGLLRRKFLYQYQNRRRDQQAVDPNEPAW
jgi:Ca-activated chloride channel family protein